MTMKKLMVAVCSLLLVTACSNKMYSGGAGSGLGSSSACDELQQRAGDRIFFDFDSSALTSEAKDVLKKQSEFMKTHPDLNFILEGHCDERGTREYNMGLGERRANAARNYLMHLGVDSSRLTIISYGKERPAILGHDEAAWGQNRRAVTVVK
jgi:peptidoglycan-associated lipoprotein